MEMNEKERLLKECNECIEVLDEYVAKDKKNENIAAPIRKAINNAKEALERNSVSAAKVIMNITMKSMHYAIEVVKKRERAEGLSWVAGEVSKVQLKEFNRMANKEFNRGAADDSTTQG